MRRSTDGEARRQANGTGLAIILAALPFAASAQASGPPGRPTDARAPGWSRTRFDLATLAPAPSPTDRAAAAGGDVELAPGLIAGVGAADRRRGAGAALATVAPAFRRQAELSGRLGLAMGGHGLLFGRLGYAELAVNEAFARADARSLSAVGVLVGAGAEARLSPALSLRTEYNAVSYRTDLSDRQLLGGLAWRY